MGALTTRRERVCAIRAAGAGSSTTQGQQPPAIGIWYKFDDSQVDAHGFASLRSHNFVGLPSFSTNFPPNVLILINGLGGNGIVEQEWTVFDLK